MSFHKGDSMKSFKLLFFIILFITSTLCTYGETLDLEDSLPTLSGLERINALLELSDKLTEENPEQAYLYAKESETLSKNNNFTAEYITALNNLGYITLFMDDYDSSIDYFQRAYTLSIENKDDIGAAFSKNGYGLIWASIDDYGNALKNFEKAQEIFEDYEHQQGLAYSLNNIGTVYESLGDYNKALDFYLQSLRLHENEKNLEEIAVSYNNIGSINVKLNNPDDALKYYIQSLQINEQLEKKNAIADNLNNIGSFFLNHGYPKDSKDYFEASLEISESLNAESKMATAYSNLALVYEGFQDYDKAFENYENAYDLYEIVRDAEGMISIQNNLGTLHNKLEEYDEALSYHEEALNLSKEFQYTEGLKSSLKNIAHDYQMKGDYQLANRYLILYSELKDTLQNQEISLKFADMQTLYETEKKDQQIELQQEDIAAKERRTRILIWILSAISFVTLIVIGLSIIIAKERAKSEKLLLNILPRKVADTLKKKGKADSEMYENVTIYFSDIINFTKLSSGLEPDYLINELNDIFTICDNIMENNSCERIKTIGDAYMAVCGMPQANPNHAENIVRAAQEILVALNKRNETSEVKWTIRTGVHTGKVVGGVVGIKKYIYDVFGDAINTASRIEANGESMKINLSETTYNLIKDKFTFQQRELLDIKGKGVIQMYFVDDESPIETV